MQAFMLQDEDRAIIAQIGALGNWNIGVSLKINTKLLPAGEPIVRLPEERAQLLDFTAYL